MVDIYSKLKKIMDTVLVGLKYYCNVTLIIMITLALIQVFMRYVMNSPLSWSDEVILLFLSWFAYPTITFRVWKDDHFYIGVVYDKLPKKLKKAADIFRHIFLFIFLVLMAYYGIIYADQFWPKPLPVTRLAQGLKFLPVILSACLSAFASITNLIDVFNKKEIAEHE